MEKAIINYVKEWLKKCPTLEKSRIETEYLNPDDEKDYYSLEQEANSTPLTKANVLGTLLKGTINFTLAGRFSFDVHNTTINSDNLKIMQDIVDWIVDNNLKGNRPIIDDNNEVKEVTVTSGPYLLGIDKSTTKSRYEIKIQINYERRVINGNN